MRAIDPNAQYMGNVRWDYQIINYICIVERVMYVQYAKNTHKKLQKTNKNQQNQKAQRTREQ